MAFTPSAVSAPGKVLIAGGYLVLDKDYSGLVFALSARIHTVSTAKEGDKKGIVVVRSPQFENALWEYNVSLGEEENGAIVKQIVAKGSSKNAFVETTLRYVLTYLSMTNPSLFSSFPSSTITILADNDYYSQPPSSAPPPKFNNLNVPISGAHKTGLGSSAALVTSLTACLLSTYSSQEIDFTTSSSQRLVHNLAQAAHCAAQGKVGSGFDIAAAVFGSCVYHRFSPSILDAVGDAGSTGFAGRLTGVVNSEWDLRVEKTRVAPGLRLVMGDVDCGSSTPGMVKKVLSWRKESSDAAKKQWDTLEELNTGLIVLLNDLQVRSKEKSEEYRAALETARSKGLGRDSGDSPSLDLLRQVEEKIKTIRANNRAMGEAAGVPIEPPAQTRLLDSAVEKTAGVLGGVVPGAGGYDAVAFLLVDGDDTVSGLKDALQGWKFEGEGEGTGGKVEALSTREEHEGVRREQVEGYAL
ncbi:phosphomevalonate kinase [Rhizina undulata]